MDKLRTVPPRARPERIEFANQGRFHPLKYCAGLVQAIQKPGGRLHGYSPYVSHEEEGGRVIITTERGPRISAGAALFATNSP